MYKGTSLFVNQTKRRPLDDSDQQQLKEELPQSLRPYSQVGRELTDSVCVCVCVYYMLQAVQSKLKVFLRTQGRVSPLTKTQGKESEKSMSNKRKDE